MQSGSRSWEKTYKSAILTVNTEALESGQPQLRRRGLVDPGALRIRERPCNPPPPALLNGLRKIE